MHARNGRAAELLQHFGAVCWCGGMRVFEGYVLYVQRHEYSMFTARDSFTDEVTKGSRHGTTAVNKVKIRRGYLHVGVFGRWSRVSKTVFLRGNCPRDAMRSTWQVRPIPPWGHIPLPWSHVGYITAPVRCSLLNSKGLKKEIIDLSDLLHLADPENKCQLETN